MLATSTLLAGETALAATRTHICIQIDGVSDVFYVNARNLTVTSATGFVPVISYLGTSTASAETPHASIPAVNA